MFSRRQMALGIPSIHDFPHAIHQVLGLSFWNTSSLIHDDRVRDSQHLYSIGITVLFGSIVCQDVNLLKWIYKSAASQLALLKSIGVSEMEKEYESRVRFVKEH
jgi:hypothetical protein